MATALLKMPQTQSPATKRTDYREALDDDESLASFLKAMRKFDLAFCDIMASGEDCTLRLEVRVHKNVLLHTRVYRDEIDRPVGVDKRLAGKDME